MAVVHANRYLAADPRIASLLAEIERNAALLATVRRALGPPTDVHCRHAVLREGLLTLTCDSPVWAARLRFAAPDLQRALESGQTRFRDLRVRVQPEAGERQTRADRPRLSAETVRHLQGAADDIGDPRIAAALRRLAQAGR